MEKFKKRYIEIIKTTYKENFNRNIASEEIDEVWSYLVPFMEKELLVEGGFSAKQFERYMNGENALLFSPANIHNEIVRAVQAVGEDKVLHSNDYKRLREMEVAARFCVAHHKKFNEKFMIKAQDNPDIILTAIGKFSYQNQRLKGLQLEVMGIPEIAKATLTGNFPAALADFIKNKKFIKRYGFCALIVSLDFTQQSVDFDKISEALIAIKDNPYESVWITGIISPDLYTVSVMQVYPKFVRVDFNLNNEPNLLY